MWAPVGGPGTETKVGAMSQECSRFREAISARMDGEEPGVGAGLLARHLQSCAECRSFEAQALALNRASRVRRAEVVPDLSQSILASFRGTRTAPDRRIVLAMRVILAATGIVQVALAAPQLLVAQDALEAPSHIAHELGTFGVALGVGFLVVAWRPTKAVGLTALSAAVALGITVTAGTDLVRGVTSLTHELDHVPEILGFALVWILAAVRPAVPPVERQALAKAS